MDIEILARFSKEKEPTPEEIQDDYVESVIGKALGGIKKRIEYYYDPVVFSTDRIYTFKKLDEYHTQIILDSDDFYNARIPYDQWLQIYQQLTARSIMKIAYTDAPQPQPKKRVERKPNVKE